MIICVNKLRNAIRSSQDFIFTILFIELFLLFPLSVLSSECCKNQFFPRQTFLRQSSSNFGLKNVAISRKGSCWVNYKKMIKTNTQIKKIKNRTMYKVSQDVVRASFIVAFESSFNLLCRCFSNDQVISYVSLYFSLAKRLSGPD